MPWPAVPAPRASPRSRAFRSTPRSRLPSWPGFSAATGAARPGRIGRAGLRRCRLLARVAPLGRRGSCQRAVERVPQPRLDVESMRWDAGLCDLSVCRRRCCRSSATPMSQASRPPPPPGFEAPVAAMLGDQPAALYGQGCTPPRMAALTLGTGAFVWLNAGATGPTRPRACSQPSPGRPRARAAPMRSRRSAPTPETRSACCAPPALSRPTGADPPDWARPHPIVVPAPAGLGRRTGTTPTG